MHSHCYLTIATIHLQSVFIIPNWNSAWALNNNFSFLFPPPASPDNIYSILFMNLTSLGTSYKWNQTVYVCPIPGSFHTITEVLKARMLTWFAIPFFSEPCIPLYICMTSFFIHSFVDGLLACFQVLAQPANISVFVGHTVALTSLQLCHGSTKAARQYIGEWVCLHSNSTLCMNT